VILSEFPGRELYSMILTVFVWSHCQSVTDRQTDTQNAR